MFDLEELEEWLTQNRISAIEEIKRKVSENIIRNRRRWCKTPSTARLFLEWKNN